MVMSTEKLTTSETNLLRIVLMATSYGRAIGGVSVQGAHDGEREAAQSALDKLFPLN